MPYGISSLALSGVTARGRSDVRLPFTLHMRFAGWRLVPSCPLERLPKFRRRGDVISFGNGVNAAGFSLKP